MKIGTKSILFGVHQFVLHPFTVAAAWTKLYGFPKDPKLWVAFFVHDLGYWGKPNMDGAEGEMHPEFGAKIMGKLFGSEWQDFCIYHSRYYAKRDGRIPSKLCAADKLSFGMTPWWLYIPLAMLSGEIYEYIDVAIERRKYEGKYSEYMFEGRKKLSWYRSVKSYLDAWAEEHRSSDKPDDWTPSKT